MEFERPTDLDNIKSADRTVIVPAEDGEYPDDLLREAIYRVNHHNATPTSERALIEPKDGYYELNVEHLAQLVWEHRQYSAAQKFSPSQLEVLLAAQRHGADGDLILTSHIVEDRTVDLAESTVSSALNNLADEGLLRKEKDGAFRYHGFEGWLPEETE
jgi:DNA-binding transcriptional ArsR family regulator